MKAISIAMPSESRGKRVAIEALWRNVEWREALAIAAGCEIFAPGW